MKRRMMRVTIICMLIMLVFSTFVPQQSSAETQPKFNVSLSTMKKDLSKHSIVVKVKGADQRFSFKTSEIKRFVVNSKKQTKKVETIKATVYIDRDVAVVKAKVTMKYKYNGRKWKISSINYTNTRIQSIKLKGKWTGTYIAQQGKTKVDINIKSVTSDGYITDGLFSFSAVPTNPSVPFGSYTLKGGFDKQTGEITFAGDEWIEHPNTYYMIEIHAYVNLIRKRITSPSNSYSLDLRRK